MAVLQCKMCGGELDIVEGSSIAKCKYCGNVNTLPKEKNTDNHGIFVRANELRIRCEFDLAEKIYEKIVENYPEEAEAYWGLVLCKYGIEYVVDPATKERIPTCHRASFETITTDLNYQKAIEYADEKSRPIYEEQARIIDGIQKEILALSYKEEKFDVFICYKETDENGKRTEDSVIANDIYYQLKDEGFKVFYAAITLEDKLGKDYEPIIFAALNSAKVMLVVGTKTEYFNAVWVKNEWSRYLKIMKQDRKKLLFPCFKNISAYELPEEFGHLQALDMGKIGFITDLVRGIKKVIVKEKPKKETSTAPTATPVSPVSNVQPVQTQETKNYNISPILRRAFILLEDGDFDKADEQLEKFLDIDPENAMAYLGKLLVDVKVKKQEKLAELSTPISNNLNFKKAYRYADITLKEKLDRYVFCIEENIKQKETAKAYERATRLLEDAVSEDDYAYVGNVFARLGDYKDSAIKAKECYDKSEELRKGIVYSQASKFIKSKIEIEILKAVPLLESIKGYKDSSKLLEEIPTFIENVKAEVYDKALKLFALNYIPRVEQAKELFLSLKDFKDSKQKAEDCKTKVETLKEEEREKRLAIEKAEKERKIKEAKKKKRNKVIAVLTVIITITAIILACTLPNAIKNNKINKELESLHRTWEEYASQKLPNGYTKSGTYIDFGFYPQSIKAESVTVSTLTDEQGYYTGSDGEKYAKVEENAYSSYKFSNGNSIINGTTYYFKVEPIRWRILSEENGKALILCQSIIANRRFDDNSNNYRDSEIRAWLNNEFFSMSFSTDQKALINTIEVDNSANSTGYSSNSYACENTYDKVFLLSYKEVTNASYCFSSSSSSNILREKPTTDYSRATGAYTNTSSDYNGNGCWWLRSPYRNRGYYARYVDYVGYVNDDFYNVLNAYVGVVPALQIQLN